MSVRKQLKLVDLYAASLLKNRKSAPFFRDIRTYCMFVGYPRTGHSLIGSLLDAHPNIVIAHELDALFAVIRSNEIPPVVRLGQFAVRTNSESMRENLLSVGYLVEGTSPRKRG